MLNISLRVHESESIGLHAENSEKISAKVNNAYQIPTGGTDNYEELKNKPSLDGVTIIGEMHEQDPTVPDWAKESKKPTYTADDVGAIGEDDAITLAEIDQIFNAIMA